MISVEIGNSGRLRNLRKFLKNDPLILICVWMCKP